MTLAWREQVELDREELLETEAAIFEAATSVGLPPRPGHQQEAASPLAGKMAMSAETVPEIPPMVGEEIAGRVGGLPRRHVSSLKGEGG